MITITVHSPASPAVDDFSGGDLVLLPAFDAVRRTVSDATRTFHNLGFLPPDGAFVGGVSDDGQRAGSAAMAAAQAAFEEIEIRDAHGRLVRLDHLMRFGGFLPGDRIIVMATPSRESGSNRW